MCENCEKFNNYKITTKGDLFKLVNELKREIKNGNAEQVFVNDQIIKDTDISSVTEGNKLNDIMFINIKCKKCNSRIRVFCETYHGLGGKVEIIKN